MSSLSLLAFCAALVVSASGSNSSTAPSNFTVSTGWYPGYHVTDVPLSSVLWSRYTHLIYAFATPSADPNVITLADSDEQLLPQFVAAAHENNVKAGLSIGGWGGSQFYSANMATETNRTAFVMSVAGLITKYNLDLVDFDWEFPGVQGIGCNTISPNDTANFLLMLQALRANDAVTSRKTTLVAAASATPWPLPSASSTNGSLAQFATVLDWVTPMVYDLSWNWTAGSPREQRALPSAPLDDSCFAQTPGANTTTGAEGLTGLGSAASAVRAWVAAGIPRAQLVLGVPAYGHSFNVNTTTAFLPSTETAVPAPRAAASHSASSASNGSLPSPSTATLPVSSPTSTTSSAARQLAPYPFYDTLNHTHGDAWDATGVAPNLCGVPQGPGGTWNFWALIAAGWLHANGSANTGAPGVMARWDECSSTPYIYVADPHPGQDSPSGSGVLISYVDPRAFAAKGAFVRANDLAGFSMWEVGGDPNGVLLDAIQSAPANASLGVGPASPGAAAPTTTAGGTSSAPPSSSSTGRLLSVTVLLTAFVLV